MNKAEEIYKNSLIAGLRLFGYVPQWTDYIKKYAKKWKINLAEYPMIQRSGLLWMADENFEIRREKLTERAYEMMTNAGETHLEYAFGIGDFEYIFNPETGEGIWYVADLLDPKLKPYMIDNKMYSYVGEANVIYETTFDINSIKEFMATKTYKEGIKNIKQWEKENKQKRR